jgi:hypothetical protein
MTISIAERNKELRFLLERNTVQLEFIKADGQVRLMTCTLRPELIELEPTSATPRRVNDEVIRVFDLDLKEWRSFRIDRLKSTKLL